MRRLRFVLSGLLAFAFTSSSWAQDSPAVKTADWTFSVTRRGDGVFLLDAKASIKKGWRLFSTTMPDTLPNSRVLVDSGSAADLDRVDEKGHLVEGREPLLNGAPIRYFEDHADFLVTLKLKGGSGKYVKGSIQFMTMQGSQFDGPDSVPFKLVLQSGDLSLTTGLGSGSPNLIRLPGVDLDHPVNTCGGSGLEKDEGLLTVFLLGFLGGLIALFTPCVFPMIPLTVSFFIKRSKDRKKGVANALLYGFFIFLIYVLLSIPFYFLPSGQESILNNISTNVWLNLTFFAVFVVFSLSFFGLFEITLPSSIATSADARSGIKSAGGIFFMALTLAVVSFSCTGPILGTLLVGSLSASASAVKLTTAMGGFGLALALPFSLFALFPNWLNSVPKSGGWLASVKVVLGFVELALAMKFFSNADLVEHWGILKREVFLGIWILIGIGLVLYLSGAIRFSSDGPRERPGPWRIGLALFVALFVLYLVPGLTHTRYANLRLISGMPPPLSYSVYGNDATMNGGVEPNVVNNYQKALALAKAEHKPLLVDFTGWACVNCRRTEENIWPQPEVKKLIQQDFILVSLYVDDRKVLPDEDQFVDTLADGKTKPIITVGDKFATMQVVNFSSISQPLYVLLSPDQQLLNKPIGYKGDAHAYADWLRCGLEAFQKTARR